jgi:single-strand DNA-binding protein
MNQAANDTNIRPSIRSNPKTAFVPCKVFGSWAKSLEQRKKGDQVVVCGRLRTEKWEKDGQPRSQLALGCESVRFLADQRLEPVGTGEGIPF